jgi:hypothetical protein
MADNVTLPATGSVVASDDVGGVQYQRVKLVDGTLDSSAGIPGDATNGLDVDVTRIQAGENHLGEVGGRTVVISASFTRPADTNAYAAGDAVTNSTSSPSQMTFSGAGRVNGASGVILSAVLIDEANQTTKGQFELWLFDTSVTPDNDNAAFARSNAECETLIGVIPFNTAFVANAGSGSSGKVVFPAPGLSIPFKCGGATTSIFGLLVVRNAYTPISAEKLVVRLQISQD